MEPIPIGLIEADASVLARFDAALVALNGRSKGHPIARAAGWQTPEGNADRARLLHHFRAWLAEYRGPLLLFADFELGPDEATDAEWPPGVALVLDAIRNPRVTPLLVVHTGRDRKPELFGRLHHFGRHHADREGSDFACLMRPPECGFPPYPEQGFPPFASASADDIGRFIEYAVGEFARLFPRFDPLDMNQIVAGWAAVADAVARPGWFGASSGARLFHTPLGDGTTHDLANWSAELFADFDTGRAAVAVNGFLVSLGPAEASGRPAAPRTLDGFWPLSCLKAMSHDLPHRAMLLAATGAPFAGFLGAHRREIRLENAAGDGRLASARVLAALRLLRVGFAAGPAEAFTSARGDVFRITFSDAPPKLDAVVLAAVARTVEDQRRAGHPTGGSFTRACEWLGQHAANLWVGRFREKGGRRAVTLAVDFEEGDLQ